MKRLVAMLLALILAVGMLPSALAADLYESMGSATYWTDAQWEEAKNWTDAQWIEYIGEETAAADAAGDTYWEEYDQRYEKWTDEQWEIYSRGEEIYYDDYWTNYKYYTKKEEGYPHPETVNVKLNGEFLTFSDALPMIREGRTMLPIRAIFEEMGGTVVWDAATKLASASFEDGTQILLALNNNILSVTREGETEEIYMDVPPFLDAATGRIYVPVRFIADAAGWEVSWDSYWEVASLINRRKIVEEIDSRFTIYNRLLAESMAAKDWEKTYALASKGETELILYGDKTDSKAAMSFDMSGLMQHMNLSLDGTVSIELGYIAEWLKLAEEEEQVEELRELLSDIDFRFIQNAETGSVYVTTNLFALDPELDPNAWIRADYQVVDTETLMETLFDTDVLTVGNLLYSMAGVGYGDTLDTLTTAADLTELLLGDRYIKTSTSGKTTTYRLTHDKKSIGAAVWAIVEEKGLTDDFFDMLDMWNAVESLTYALEIKEVDGKVADISMTGGCSITGAFPWEMSFSLVGDKYTSEVDFVLAGGFIGKITFSGKSEVRESRKAVPSAPPAGETVIDESISSDPLPEILY